MGYALADSAKRHGAHVTLVSGPVTITPPVVDELISVKTADEMHLAVMQRVHEADIFIGVAAVSDYRAAQMVPQKIAKKDERLMIELVRNKDIIASVGALKQKPLVVGFAAETHNILEHAHQKRLQKGIDLMIANSAVDAIGHDENKVTVLSDAGNVAFDSMPKTTLANHLIQLIGKTYKERL
jgi:phosphopantothenoylcysteine decarboxylase/phosphopantothenate--cysteine ligase